MRRYILICAALIVISISFAACSNENSMFSAPTTTTQMATVTDDSGSRVFYDKKGNKYSSVYEIVYYDRHSNEYLYQKDGDDVYFLSSDGKKLDIEKCFVNSRGIFMYDSKGELTMAENYMSATDKDGNVYYPASTVRWTEDGELIPFFGFGDMFSSDEQQ
ncbi:MAG: hypothetical protein ACLUFN_01535 [Eubacterium sp.]